MTLSQQSLSFATVLGPTQRVSVWVAPREGGDLGTVYNLTNAFVGFEAAVSFRDFVENYERQVTVEDILDQGKIDKTASFGINDHSALVEKMEATAVFKTRLTDGQTQNLADYFLTLPSEVAMKLWTVLGESDDVQNTIKLHQATSTDGVSVSEHLVELLGGGAS